MSVLSMSARKLKNENETAKKLAEIESEKNPLLKKKRNCKN